MTAMSALAVDLSALYAADRDRVDFIDVPELGCLVARGGGAPGGADFAAAIQALYAVTYGAHFIAKPFAIAALTAKVREVLDRE